MPNDALATPLAQRYRLLDKLGEGGMGAVFKAHDAKLDRTVAIKIMAVDLVKHPDALARFQREAKALAKVSHPGIVQAFDCGEDGGQHFLVMEYVEGRSLMEVLRGHGKIPPTIAADYAHQAALALYHAHERGLIHRDIKPQNLLLATSGQVKVLDLGLARFAQDHLGESALTRENAGMGTPDYMAPEQFTQAHHADARSDIYSLGCTLFHVITGQVPFPGTSLAEKTRAHEEQEPPSIEELCPEAPVGLALTIRRMLAKKPADRFQTMLEVAEALAPYVAGSSISLSDLKKTTDWTGSQLSFHALPDRPTKPSGTSHRDTPVSSPASTRVQAPTRSRLVKYGVIGLAAVLLVGLLAGLPFLLRSDAPPTEPKDTGGTNGTAANEVAPPADPNVLTVSKDPRHKAQFDTINAALEQVKPGMTVRVLDDATYTERIGLQDSDQFNGLTLEAPRRARIHFPAPGRIGLNLVSVRKVTVRGFRIMSDRPGTYCAGIRGSCSDVSFEDMELECKDALASGIGLEQIVVPKGERPIRIANCSISGGEVGVQILGYDWNSKLPQPCSGIVVRNNRISRSLYGILLGGQVSQVQVVGNTVDRSASIAVWVPDILKGGSNLLLANNTVMSSGQCLQIGNLARGLDSFEIRNNLIVSNGGTDLVYAGNDREALKQLTINHNWRQVRSATPGAVDTTALIATANDQIRDKIELLSTDPQSPDFLRPAKDSPLATQGAGQTDPRLPMYVGAVPPEGVSPWDWERTWRMPKDAQLLTVSKDEKDGGQYRTINDALKDAKPWATVRVLDGGTYEESIKIDDAQKLKGISLEATQRASISVIGDQSRGIAIQGVPHVRVQGFRLRLGKTNLSGILSLVWLRDDCRGAIIENLDMSATGKVIGVKVVDGRGSPDAVIQVRNNRISATKGIDVEREAQHVYVVGNVVLNNFLAGIEIENPGEASRDVLVANNTVFNFSNLFRVWDSRPSPQFARRQVEFCNNVLFDAEAADAAYVYASPESTTANPAQDLAEALVKAWHLHYNARDRSGTASLHSFSLGPTDLTFERSWLMSRDPASPDFLRPAVDSPLATGGAGKDDPSLPLYVGAVPPKGTPAWDWDRTWRWRMRNRPSTEESKAGR